jgi:hypothetical protein
VFFKENYYFISFLRVLLLSENIFNFALVQKEYFSFRLSLFHSEVRGCKGKMKMIGKKKSKVQH